MLLVIVVGKSVAAFAIVLAFGRPLATALTVAASLAQIGEFSFILAGLGIALGLLPPEGRDLILAGALLSITLNPLVFVGVDRLGSWLQSRSGPEPAVASPTADAPGQSAYAGPDGQVVLVGFGRVGSVVGRGLKAQGLPVVVVEQDRRRVDELRAAGYAAVYGDAARPGILELARVGSAQLIVLAMPEGFQTQAVLERVRELSPGIDVAVRAHSESEVAALARENVGIAIMGERELAFGLLTYALRSLGTGEEAARLVVQKARITGDGGVFERQSEAPARGAPELRHHRLPEDEAGDDGS